MTKISIDPCTTTCSKVEMKFGQTMLSTGTCFFWATHGDHYLVTNWHNLSGINPATGKHLSAHGGEPDRLRFDVFFHRNLNKRVCAEVVIESEDGPLWIEHPIHRNHVDVACFKLPDELGQHVLPINAHHHQSLLTQIADEVFILGFPMGIGPERLPIWKRASVASEPEIDVEGLPKFLVDTATAKGMSGSPVIRRAVSGMTENGSFGIFSGPVSRFVGIYSGRIISGSSLEAQIGVVWKSRVIDEIIEGQKQGKRR